MFSFLLLNQQFNIIEELHIDSHDQHYSCLSDKLCSSRGSCWIFFRHGNIPHKHCRSSLWNRSWTFSISISSTQPTVGAKSDQQVNICSFVVRCYRMWPSTQWHWVYTGWSNVPYVQFESVGDFIPEPRCSKFAVELQTSGNRNGCVKGLVEFWTEGPRVTGAPTCTKYGNVCSV